MLLYNLRHPLLSCRVFLIVPSETCMKIREKLTVGRISCISRSGNTCLNLLCSVIVRMIFEVLDRMRGLRQAKHGKIERLPTISRRRSILSSTSLVSHAMWTYDNFHVGSRTTRADIKGQMRSKRANTWLRHHCQRVSR